MNINNIKSQPTSFTNCHIEYAVCTDNGDIMAKYMTLESAKTMLNLGSYIQELFVYKGKILALGDVI
jgi:hypothetical protein